MKLSIVKSYEDMSKKAAKIVLDEVSKNKKIRLGFATGSTPLGLYSELALACQNKKADFSEVKTFNLDEYYPIKKTNPQSYHYFMHKNLFDKLNLKESNIHLLNGEASDFEEECKRYEKMIDREVIDLQILGIGSNGHIGFNEKGTNPHIEVHRVKLSGETKKANSRFFKSIKEVPEYALTIGLKNIMATKKIILLAKGKEKAQAVKDMIEGKISTSDCPASVLQHHKDCTVILDEDAAGLLK
jgi:glucosamine-6-phosphate deaminase